MHKITYTITTLAPIVIAARYGDMNLINTEQYIPGTSMLGVLVKRFLENKQIPSSQALQDNQFHRWFLLGDLKIGNAYIVSYDESENKRVHFPTPFSIHQEKHHKEEIYDLLYDEDFDKQTKYLKNFCAIEDRIIYTKHVATELNFHHARYREKGVSKEGAIFTYEAIAKGQTFEGEIRGEEQDLNALLDVCKGDSSGWIAYIGRSKNAQYGQVKIEFSTPSVIPERTILPESTMKEEPISLTLLSDTIVYNKHGFPTTDIKDLREYLPKAELYNDKAIIKTGSVENFISVWRLKKPSETCFAAGSTFRLDISDCDVKQLAQLEVTGIGERTHEGFGQCKFGWQGADIRLQEETSDEEILPPSFLMTPKVKEILKTVAQETFEKRAASKALVDLNEFIEGKTLPESSSLISRLQAIAKRSQHQQDFANSLSALKKTAKDKLERCHNKDKKLTLFDFLTEKKELVETLLGEKFLKSLCDDIQYDIDEIKKEMETMLFHIYFDTFFAMMRKQAAKGGK